MANGSSTRATPRVERLRPARGATTEPPALDRSHVVALETGAHCDPFAILGPHRIREGDRDQWFIRAYLPGAISVELRTSGSDRLIARLAERQTTGLFVGRLDDNLPYVLKIEWTTSTQIIEDAYSFGPCLASEDLALISLGRHPRLHDCLGARAISHEGVDGVSFAVWAPNARAVSVVGDFNSWDARRHPMRLRHVAGVWELFAPRLSPGERYKFAILGPDGERLPLKADPVALRAEMPPATASVVAAPLKHHWRDEEWMASRAARHRADAPISIYEVHLGSWLKPPGGEATWRFAREHLAPYVQALGFTHIELLPVAEHPFRGSWGYQPLSLFAPTARHGEAAEFAAFVDECHQRGLGVILDWVPAHFPGDAHGPARFDGTALYEHADPREGWHPDWNTLIYNFGRREVAGFLTSSAIRWLEDFHVDGLRVDAVASMLYRDYSRRAGEWIPNAMGGRENLEAIDFLRHVNALVAERCPGAMMIAEESTAFPGVTMDVGAGGLGFHYKWNMGWMNDTLRYLKRDPIHRRWHHDEITFGLCYAHSEKFVLPLSHDEVVHGKGSLVMKMPGDDWRRRATLRALLGFMWTYPGKKLLFMGGEFAQTREWNHDAQLDWPLLDDPRHASLMALTRDLNRLYREDPALHQGDAHPDGFKWLIVDDRDNSVFAYLRLAFDASPLAVIVNMTPEPRRDYIVGVPHHGFWREALNTDSAIYGGGDIGNLGGALTRAIPAHGAPQSLCLTLPPLATIVLRYHRV